MKQSQEQDPQQAHWEQFFSTLPKEVTQAVNNKRIQDTMEVISLRFYLRGLYDQQFETDALQPIVDEQARLLASSQKTWGDAPMRKDLSQSELIRIRDQVAQNTANLSEIQTTHKAAEELVSENYPELIEMVMKRIRNGHTTPIPQRLVEILYRSEQEQPTAQLGDTIYATFRALFQSPEESIQSLPAPAQQESKPEQRQVMKPGVEQIVPQVTWKTMGIDAGSARYQGFNTAIQKLYEANKEYFPGGHLTLQILTQLWMWRDVGDDASIFVLLNEAFRNKPDRVKGKQVTEVHIARIYALLAWNGNPDEPVTDGEEFREHAIQVQNGTAKNLWPDQTEVSAQAAPASAVRVENKAKPISADRFPQTDEEIEAYIRDQHAKMILRMEKDRMVSGWPKNHNQLCQFAERKFSTEIVDEAIKEKFIKPTNPGEYIPTHSRLNYIIIMALHDFREHPSSHKFNQAMKRFDEIGRELGLT